MPSNPLISKVNYHDPNSFGNRIRARRMRIFLEMAEEVFRQYGSVHIIDMGGSSEYWNILDAATIEKLHIHITIINVFDSMPGLKQYMSYVKGDACEMYQFADKSFHLAHSNSVIEHVGSDENKKRFAREVFRVAERYYIQTPNFYFPFEPHFLVPFFHWLPRWLRMQLSLLFTMGHYMRTESWEEADVLMKHNEMLSKRDMVFLFPDARIIKEKFFGLTKSIIAIG